MSSKLGLNTQKKPELGTKEELLPKICFKATDQNRPPMIWISTIEDLSLIAIYKKCSFSFFSSFSMN